MLDIVSWTEAFAAKLEEAFATRMRFVGYQGSYGRGEATPESDIDIVTILDKVAPRDLDAYRGLVRAQLLASQEFCLPGPADWPLDRLEACGFICGEEELYAWPRADSVNLLLDTADVFGGLRPLLPKLTFRDAWEGMRQGASGLYHAACHAWLYDGDPKTALPGLGKSAFFCLRLWLLCCRGLRLNRKKEMFAALSQRERALLRLSMEPGRTAAFTAEETERAYGLLIDWCGELLRQKEPAGLDCPL